MRLAQGPCTRRCWAKSDLDLRARPGATGGHAGQSLNGAPPLGNGFTQPQTSDMAAPLPATPEVDAPQRGGDSSKNFKLRRGMLRVSAVVGLLACVIGGLVWYRVRHPAAHETRAPAHALVT